MRLRDDDLLAAGLEELEGRLDFRSHAPHGEVAFIKIAPALSHGHLVDVLLLRRAKIERNLVALKPLGASRAEHFCYPSGQYVEQHARWLKDFGIRSATTTNFGLASPEHSPYFLPRICDSDDMPELDFLAAVSGFKDLYAGIRA